MNYLFIAPIDIRADASAGAETINAYINEFSCKADNHIIVISRSKGRYQKKNIEYITIKKNNDKAERFYKALGWIFRPRSRYLFKTMPSERSEIIGNLTKLKRRGFAPDIIMLEATPVILMVDDIREKYPRSLLIASLHDFSFQGSKRRADLETSRLKSFIRKRYLRWAEEYEVAALSHCDIICPHNAGNKDILQKYEELKNSTILPLVPYYSNGYHHNDEQHTNDIIFYGLMNRPENYTAAIWFVRNVFPMIDDRYRFIIVGGKPTEELCSLSSDRIIVTGFIDEFEVKKYFENAFCMVVPLLTGSGIKTKVLSALKCGLPVLTNAIGAEGIDIKDGEEYYHCEKSEDYLAAIRALEDNIKYREISANAKTFMENNYNIEDCAKILEQKFAETNI